MASPKAAPPEFQSVTEYLVSDHLDLDVSLIEAIHEVNAGHFEAARSIYGEFHRGLAHHMRSEEEVLFPMLEARLGTKEGPTEAMREEHRRIRESMTALEQALERNDTAAFKQGVQWLYAVLPEHNAKEERMLYPVTDRLLSDDERKGFVRRLQQE